MAAASQSAAAAADAAPKRPRSEPSSSADNGSLAGHDSLEQLLEVVGAPSKRMCFAHSL